jgi:hypothetical protein
MNLIRFVSAACLAATFGLSPVSAAPFPDPGALPAEESLVVPVHGCHADVRRGFVNEFGRTVNHRHQRNCRPVRVTGSSARHCHRDVRQHYERGWGRVVHRHVGSSCRVQVYRRYDRPGRRDCVWIGRIRFCAF